MHADLDTLVVALYVSVDDLLGPRTGPGRPPKLSDAELVCLAVAQVLLGYGSERQWLRVAGRRLGHLFPYLPTPSAYNRRLRRAAPLVALAIRDLALHTPSWCDQLRLVDSTPLPCAASRETVKRSALAGHAGYGYCKSHHRYFWGFRLYLFVAADGLPVPGAWPAPTGVSGRSWPSCWRSRVAGCGQGWSWSGTKGSSAGRWTSLWLAMGPGSCGLTAKTSHPGSAP